MKFHPYNDIFDRLSYPSDKNPDNPYPFYDRWSDTFNVTNEFTIPIQARGMASTAYLMAQTLLKEQPWHPVTGDIEIYRVNDDRIVLEFHTSNELDLNDAQIIWEISGQSIKSGISCDISTSDGTITWVEVEALWGDGRRIVSRIGNLDHALLQNQSAIDENLTDLE